MNDYLPKKDLEPDTDPKRPSNTRLAHLDRRRRDRPLPGRLRHLGHHHRRLSRTRFRLEGLIPRSGWSAAAACSGPEGSLRFGHPLAVIEAPSKPPYP